MTAYDTTPYEIYAKHFKNRQTLRGTTEGDRHYHKAPEQAPPPVRIPPSLLGGDEKTQLSELHIDSVGVAPKSETNGLKPRPQRKLID